MSALSTSLPARLDRLLRRQIPGHLPQDCPTRLDRPSFNDGFLAIFPKVVRHVQFVFRRLPAAEWEEAEAEAVTTYGSKNRARTLPLSQRCRHASPRFRSRRVFDVTLAPNLHTGEIRPAEFVG